MSLARTCRGNDDDIFPSKAIFSQLFLVVPQTKGFSLNFLLCLPSLQVVHFCVGVVWACGDLWNKVAAGLFCNSVQRGKDVRIKLDGVICVQASHPQNEKLFSCITTEIYS